jgi:hypothetical protein
VLSPKPSSGQWTFACQPVGGEIFSAWVPLLVSVVVAGVLIGATHGTLKVGAVVVAVALVVLVGARTRRIGVWADADPVVVQNFWRTHDFAWADVERLRAATLDRYRGWIFDLRDGRHIGADGIPLRETYAWTRRLASTARSQIQVDTGTTKPDDF